VIPLNNLLFSKTKLRRSSSSQAQGIRARLGKAVAIFTQIVTTCHIELQGVLTFRGSDHNQVLIWAKVMMFESGVKYYESPLVKLIKGVEALSGFCREDNKIHRPWERSVYPEN
jgi:hypothetical protein